MLSVLDVRESAVLRGGRHLDNKPDHGEEHFDEAFPLPAGQAPPSTTAPTQLVYGERDRRRERRSALCARGQVAPEDVNSPPDSEDDEERARQRVTLKTAHHFSLYPLTSSRPAVTIYGNYD